MTISVIGLGYMGLPMAAVLAANGHKVIGVDVNPARAEAVNAGRCPFPETGLPELLEKAHASGNLSAVTVPQPADVFILSLPTPVDHALHTPDMSFVEAGVTSMTPVLKAGDLVVLESTSPVGATRKHVKDVVERLRPELADKIDYVFCPERAIPGATVREMVENDRLVGGLTPQATGRGLALYQSFCTGQLLPCTAAEAEMVKLVENASRDAQIAFANELSTVCAKMGLDVWNVIKLANHHPRVNILTPGTGVGGHCIAVDPWFIIAEAPELTPQMQATRATNDDKPLWVVEQIEKAVAAAGGTPCSIACLGLAYKPDVDDLRESPAITVIEELKKRPGFHCLIVEPHIRKHNDYAIVPLSTAVAAAKVVVSLTAHSAFKALPDGALAGKMVVDPCGIFQNRNDVTHKIA
ncbi:MAG TPA: nucleotide sugar dehydrogenase [Alphaproteobacteria bacterium]|nr:nucleotide sugar dehydrogenase [Alphaproteobacteria bacterium]